MITVKQMVRQPLKTASGVIIIALAVAILVVCVGQYSATELTRSNMDDRYSTVALLSDTYFWQETESGNRVHLSSLPDEIRGWIDELIHTRTELVKAESSTGLISAYIPELTIDNFSRYEDGNRMGDYNVGNPYRCAMLEVSLTRIGTVVNRDVSTFISGEQEQELLNYISILCLGEVESVLGLEQGFCSPVGKTILLTISVYSEEDFEALQLRTGQRYLVYGMDYSDMGGTELQNKIMNNPEAYQELFGRLSLDAVGFDFDSMMAQIDCTLTVCDESALPWNTKIEDETGAFIGFASIDDERPFYYLDSDGYHMTSVSAEAYISDYQIPTITALDGATEDFLSSKEGDLWRKALDEMQISNHGFPVLAVEKLGYQASFSRDQARIVVGRDFSESELLNGEKVCILSESLATSNDLQVGDAIRFQSYAYDPNIKIQRTEMMNSTAFPSAAVFSCAMGLTSEVEYYTIVGLYRQENAWQNQNDPYGFTPNTIFVPKNSVSEEMLPYTDGIYSTLVIRNGKMAEFQALMEEAGYPGLFVCYDSGYAEIVSALSAYEGVSVKALNVGVAAYAVLMLLFVILFPAQQGKTLSAMCSLGASRGKRVRHVIASSAGILFTGAMIGGFAGALLWEQVTENLMASLNVQVPLEANMLLAAPVLCIMHSLLASMVVLVISIPMTSNNSVMKHK